MYKKGNEWKYLINNSQELVMKVEEEYLKDGKVFLVNNGYINNKLVQQQRLFIETNEIYLYESNGVVIDPCQIFIKFPLQINDFWIWEGRIGMQNLKYSTIVSGKQSVLMKEKNIETFIVETNMDMGSQGKMQVKKWLNPDLGIIKEETQMQINGKEQKIISNLIDYAVK